MKPIQSCVLCKGTGLVDGRFCAPCLLQSGWHRAAAPVLEATRALVKGPSAEQLHQHLRHYNALRDALELHDRETRKDVGGDGSPAQQSPLAGKEVPSPSLSMCDVCTKPCSGDRVVCGGCLQIASDLVKTGTPVPCRSEAQPEELAGVIREWFHSKQGITFHGPESRELAAHILAQRSAAATPAEWPVMAAILSKVPSPRIHLSRVDLERAPVSELRVHIDSDGARTFWLERGDQRRAAAKPGGGT